MGTVLDALRQIEDPRSRQGWMYLLSLLLTVPWLLAYPISLLRFCPTFGILCHAKQATVSIGSSVFKGRPDVLT